MAMFTKPSDIHHSRLVCVFRCLQVLDFLTHVTICQRYTNTFNRPLEVRYVFPMDAGAAVNRLHVTVDDRVIEGMVMESGRARDAYTAAVRAGLGAVLVQQSEDSVDVFEARVGSVLPHHSVTVRISYVSEVTLEGSDLRFVLPTAVAPRYTPAPSRAVNHNQLFGRYVSGDDDDEDRGTTSDAAASIEKSASEYTVSVRLAIETASAITSITSSSHAATLSVKMGTCGELYDGGDSAALVNTRALVTMGVTGGVGLGGDFVVVVKQEQPHQPRVWVETLHDDRDSVVSVAEVGAGGAAAAAAAVTDTRAIMVSLYPDLRSLRWHHDPTLNFVFVVDRSGSMGGWKMAGAKQTLQLCLRSLPPGSLFQIVCFGTFFSKLFHDGSAVYDDDTLARATSFVDGMSANMGT